MVSVLDADRIAFLRETFACSADIAASIGRRANDRRYPTAAIILKQGDRADATFLMVIGRAHAMSYGSDGQAVLLHEIRARRFLRRTGPMPAPEDADGGRGRSGARLGVPAPAIFWR